MPNPKSHESFPDARAFLNRALENENGAEAVFDTPGGAFKFRMNCYTVRERERKRACKSYPEDHALFGKSPWDGFTFRLVEEGGVHLVQALHGESSLEAYQVRDPVTKEKL